MTSSGIPVLAAPNFDPGARRVEMELPAGLTVAEIVAQALPGATSADLAHARVALVNDRGSMIVDPQMWHVVRPNPGVRVVIRLTPGKDALRSVLQIVVSVAAIALGAAFGPALGVALGFSGQIATAVGAGLIGLGVSIIGQLLINALIPPVKADTDRRNTYSATAPRNRIDPDGAVPFVLGKLRYYPPYAATPFTEIVGDDQYIRALFCFGEGEVTITDLRLGETDLSEYDEVETEIRNGVAGEDPVTIVDHQVVEEVIGVELTRPLPRNDAGDVIEGQATEDEPVIRTTGPDAQGASVILSWPGGLVRYDDEGRKQSRTVVVRIEQRRADAEDWTLVEEINVTAKKAEGFFRQHSWTFPERTRWQVRMTMLTDETEDSRIQQRTTWVALQTIRPEYPLNFSRPLALVALRIKATHQLNGQLDNFSGVVSRVCPDWDAASGQWVRRETERPASLFREVLQHGANPKPQADSEMDLELIQSWHEHSEANALTYNRVLEDTNSTLRDVLTEIAAAGRATPRHDGQRWGVVIDRPSRTAPIVDHLNPRNSWAFKWSRSYTNPPHAFVVKFLDAGNDYKETQRTIRWPGYSGAIELTEELQLPGKVYADEVWREARRRQLETIYRPDTYQATQDGTIRVITRGDAIATSHYVLSDVQFVGRVRKVVGKLVELDESVTMEPGQSYVLRYRVFDDEDTIGTSVTRGVKAVAGETDLLTLTDSGPAPVAGSICHFGPAGLDSYQQIVTGIEMTEDMCTIVHLVDAAPEIDEELALTEIPAWSSRVGAEADAVSTQPPAPIWVQIRSGLVGAGETNLISYLIAPGSGSIRTARYLVEYRRVGDANWTQSDIAAADGGGDVSGYATGDLVDFRARAVSPDDIVSAYGITVRITVGAEDAAIPAALDDAGISITTTLGGALIQVATGTDTAVAQLQVYRSTSATLNRAADASGDPIPVSPQQTVSTTLGDTTRANMISGGAMNVPSVWTLDAGWSIADGIATHAAGTADALSQAFNAASGKAYRISITLADVTAGSVTPALSGGTDQVGTARTTAGTWSDRIEAVAGNDTIELRASADFDGTLDDVIAYLETSACLEQGSHFVWIEPQNAQGVPGPVSGPFAIEVQ